MQSETLKYNDQLEVNHKEVCDVLAEEIDRHLAEAKNDMARASSLVFGRQSNCRIQQAETRHTADVLERSRF